MNELNNKLHPLFSIPVAIVIALIYMSFVYKSWNNIEEFIALTPAFLFTGLSVGMFVSLMPVRKPLLFSFSVSALAPVICGLASATIKMFFGIAMASEGKMNLPTTSELFWAYFLFLGVVFGLVSMFGCYIGLLTQKVISKRYSIAQNGDEDTGMVDSSIVAAKLGVNATLIASLIGAVASFIVAFIK